MSKTLQSAIRWDCADSAMNGLFQTVHPHTWEKKKKEVKFFYLPNTLEKYQSLTLLHFHHNYLTFFSGDILILLFEARTIVLACPKETFKV